MVYENMKQEIIKRGGVVHCGVEVLGIKTQGKKAVGIHTNKGEFSGDIVISTAPFRDMVLSLEELDSSVKEMAGRLKFRNTILVYVEVGDLALLKKHRLSPNASIVLGEHSHDCENLGAVITSKVTPTPKSPQNEQSPTAIPRILEEENQATNEKSTSQESSFENNTKKSQKVDSSTATILKQSAKDSRICKNAQNVSDSLAAGFCDDFVGCQGNDKGATLSVVTAVAASDSRKSAQKPTLFKDNWIYVHSKDTQTGRITNFANWTKDLQCGQDSAILCLEYWANDDEALWNLDDNALSEIAKRDLLESKLVADSSLIKNTSVLKIHKSYPVYERGYKDNLHKIYKALDSFKDLYFIGRNGSFKYNNQDHSILMGLMCADKILGRECDLWHINTDYDYQEGGKSE